METRGSSVYLKSLEIQGFKSFPDRTVLQFGEDLTAIVGPNGSGKSNISDAIRWVMGEQSTKALRGAKMEDVIFGGTQKRGAVGFAEATLVLDNSDGAFRLDSKEIAVTRRYYRSGDSEFYINRRSARLRDINELFMDTGLGREGYSNISQGRIDEILSLRSVDRREIFEEAAGISKFRHRKEETERRLASTQDNLTRISDKISELELQVEPLRVQAEKARKYLAYREELKGLEVAVWLESLDRLSAAAQKAEVDYNSAVFILAQSHETLDNLYALAEELSQKLRAQDAETERIRTEMAELSGKVQELEGAIAVLDNNINNNLSGIERITQELSDAGDRHSSVHAQIEGHDLRIAEIGRERAAIDAEILDHERERSTFAANADALTQRYVECSQAQAALSIDIADKRVQLSAVEESERLSNARQEEIASQMLLANARLQEAEAQYQDCKKKLDNAREDVTCANNTIAGYTMRLSARAQKRDALKSQLDRLEIDLQTAQSRLRMYREMEREYEGYSKAVKHTMQQARTGALRGVHGPISSLIRTADEYTVAIEIAMGGAMQYIVVDDERAGKAAIENLKRANGGRNTFYPLTTIRGRQISEPGLSEEPGFVGIASELVSRAPHYDEIIRHILGRTVIVEDMDDALAISRRYGRRFRIVTLDGQIVNIDSSMTGGSASRNAGILSRANEVLRLSEQITAMTAKLETVKKDLEAAQSEAAQAEYQRTTAQGELRQAEDAVLRLEGELRQHTILRDAVNDAIENGEQEKESLAARAKLDHDRSLTLTAQLALLEKNLHDATCRLADISTGKTEALAKVQAISDEISRLRVSASALDAERQSAEVARDHLRELEAAMQGDRSQKEALLESLAQDNCRMELEKAWRGEEKQAAAASMDRSREALGASSAKRISIEESKTKAEREAQEKSKEILDMEREAARLEQKKLSAEMEEKQIVDKLWDNYELTRSKAVEAASPIESVAGAQRSIADLKRKIHALGEPNIGAISQFELVNERYQYLCTQRDDVLQAKKELEGIIGTITDQMQEIFVTEFAKINTYFGQTFTEMFGGGRASLVLEDPTQPLSCGIEIRVQPPGKQLKTITLLSGGEKAFVAIALYFAILKVRPTPFCMLDEIDAALDDRNVERFAEYLRTLCEKTQFIVITHRRGTMEHADILYGVTMQEQGVSKIIQLELRQLAEQLGITE